MYIYTVYIQRKPPSIIIKHKPPSIITTHTENRSVQNADRLQDIRETQMQKEYFQI